MKLIEEREYKGHRLDIRASYHSDRGIHYKGAWYNGRVLLRGDIYNSHGVWKGTSTAGDTHDGRYVIGFRRIYKNFGPIEFIVGIEHISDVYEREYKKFIDDLENWVDRMLEINEEKEAEKKITDGLPDSLRNL